MRTDRISLAERLAYSQREASIVSGISPAELRAAIRAGQLPVSRIGKRTLRILRADLEAWLRSHRIRLDDPERQAVERVLERERATSETSVRRTPRKGQGRQPRHDPA